MANLLNKTIIRRTIIIYDVALPEAQPKVQSRLKDILRSKGYQDFIIGINAKGEEGKTYLPCNTIWKANISPKDAKAELREAAKFCGAVVERCFAADFQEWSGMSLKPVSEQSQTA